MTNEHKSRILVIDDEPQILRVLRRGLESQGFEVATAPDAESGLERVVGDVVGDVTGSFGRFFR